MIRTVVVPFFATAVFIIPLFGPAHAQETPAGLSPAVVRAAAQDTARAWLRTVDSGVYGRAWDDAATVFQGAVTRGAWQKQASRARAELGPLRLRKQAQTQYRDSLRQVPDAGPFVLLAYRSRFDEGLYVETILTVREEGAWAVAAYRVAPVQAPSRPSGASAVPPQ